MNINDILLIVGIALFTIVICFAGIIVVCDGEKKHDHAHKNVRS